MHPSDLVYVEQMAKDFEKYSGPGLAASTIGSASLGAVGGAVIGAIAATAANVVSGGRVGLVAGHTIASHVAAIGTAVGAYSGWRAHSAGKNQFQTLKATMRELERSHTDRVASERMNAASKPLRM